MFLFLKISLVIFLLNTDLSASFKDQDEEEWNLSEAFRKYFICFNKPLLDDENQILLEEFHKINKIEIITFSEEILWTIIINLSPRGIKQLSYTCKYLEKFIKEDFWNFYIKTNRQKKWHSLIYSEKVAFAHLFYREGKIKKAAILGLPQAILNIKNLEKYKNNTISHSSTINRPYLIIRDKLK